MNIETFSVGSLQTNCYLVWDGDQAIIIDPGDEGEFLSEKILADDLTLTKIILTHAHFDHVLGILSLKLNFDIPIYLHEKDLFLYKQASSSATHWAGITTPPPPLPDFYLKEGEGIVVGNNTLKVIHTPGHTPGSICLYEQQEKILFTGDLLFKNGVGRTDFSYSRPLELHDSLAKISTFPPETVIYSGHGEPTTLGSELGGADGNRTRA